MTTTAREQFVEDFLLVAMNDQATYKELMAIVQKPRSINNDDYSLLAKQLENWWSWKVEEMMWATNKANKPTLSLFIGQFLHNWGIDTWQHIADYLCDKDDEIKQNEREKK